MVRKVGKIEIVSYILIIFLILGFSKWWPADTSIGVATGDVSFSYIVKYGKASHKDNALPMLVALHGNGDTPANFYASALDLLNSNVRIILLRGPISQGSGSAWPKAAADFSLYGNALNEAINLLALEFPTTGKPILMGFSGGGMMAYYQAVRHGATYSSIFPISGQLSQQQLGDDLIEPAADVFAYHGTRDRVLSIKNARDTINILRKYNVEVDFVEFEGGHHGLFTNMKSIITQKIEQQIESIRQHKR